MKKQPLMRYIFTEDELKEKLGITGDIENIFQSTVHKQIEFEVKVEDF